MVTWSKEFLSEFVEEFGDLPSLWKVKSKEYHNRDLKEKAYSKLLEKVKTVDHLLMTFSPRKTCTHLHSTRLQGGLTVRTVGKTVREGGPNADDRPGLSSEGAPDIDETVNVKQKLMSGHEPQMGLDTKTD
jgi:hypothetical protein